MNLPNFRCSTFPDIWKLSHWFKFGICQSHFFFNPIRGCISELLWKPTDTRRIIIRKKSLELKCILSLCTRICSGKENIVFYSMWHAEIEPYQKRYLKVFLNAKFKTWNLILLLSFCFSLDTNVFSVIWAHKKLK